ncbi:MAG: hypothetical protein WD334_05975, partial [Chitinophagales bacterium]
MKKFYLPFLLIVIALTGLNLDIQAQCYSDDPSLYDIDGSLFVNPSGCGSATVEIPPTMCMRITVPPQGAYYDFTYYAESYDGGLQVSAGFCIDDGSGNTYLPGLLPTGEYIDFSNDLLCIQYNRNFNRDWSGDITSAVLTYNKTKPTGGTVTANPTSSCEGGDVVFTASGFNYGFFKQFQYRWNGTGSWNNWSTNSPHTWESHNTSGNSLQVRAVIDNDGCIAYSSPVTHYIYDDPTVTVSGNDHSVCLGHTGSFTANGSGGIGATESYQWIRRVNGGSVVNLGTSATQNITFNSTGTWEIAVFYEKSGEGCDGIVSPTRTITVVGDPAELSDAVFSTSSICTGGNTSVNSELTGGTGTETPDWQYFNGSNWVNISNGTPAEFSYTGLNTSTLSITTTGNVALGNYDFRRKLNSTVGCNATSNYATLTIVADPSISIVGQGTTECVDATSGTTLYVNTNTGGGGSCSIQWQKSTIGSGAGFSNVPGATSTSLATGAITQDSWYRVQRSCTGSGCTNAVSGVIELSPAPGLPAVLDTTFGCGNTTINISPDSNYANTARVYSDQSLSNLLYTGVAYQTDVSGDYYITSYNSNSGCESSDSAVYLSSSPAFATSFIKSSVNNPHGYDVICHDGDNAFIQYMEPSDYDQYLYNWSNGEAGIGLYFLYPLSPGQYSVTVSDTSGNCSVVDNFEITEPPAITFDPPVIDEIDCYGGTGSISVNANNVYGDLYGGSVTYIWSNGNTGSTQSGLLAGGYTVTVQDDWYGNRCTASTSYTLSQPDSVKLSLITSYPCNTSGLYDQGVVTILADGGTPPYEYKKGAGGTYSSSNVYGNLLDNTSYTFYVRDANACEKSQTVDIDFPLQGEALGVCEFVYVSATGEGPLGTLECPTDLITGINIAEASSNRKRILLLAGNYTITETVEIPNNVSLDGSFENMGDYWRKNTGLTSTLNINPPEETAQTDIAHKIGIKAHNISNFSIKDLTVNVSGVSNNSRTSNGYGKSVYGLHISGASDYTITRVEVNTGNASSGANGA